MKPQLKNEITTGQLLMMVSFLAGLGLLDLPKPSEFRAIQAVVSSQNRLIEKIDKNIEILNKNDIDMKLDMRRIKDKVGIPDYTP